MVFQARSAESSETSHPVTSVELPRKALRPQQNSPRKSRLGVPREVLPLRVGSSTGVIRGIPRGCYFGEPDQRRTTRRRRRDRQQGSFAPPLPRTIGGFSSTHQCCNVYFSSDDVRFDFQGRFPLLRATARLHLEKRGRMIAAPSCGKPVRHGSTSYFLVPGASSPRNFRFPLSSCLWKRRLCRRMFGRRLQSR